MPLSHLSLGPNGSMVGHLGPQISREHPGRLRPRSPHHPPSGQQTCWEQPSRGACPQGVPAPTIQGQEDVEPSSTFPKRPSLALMALVLSFAGLLPALPIDRELGEEQVRYLSSYLLCPAWAWDEARVSQGLLSGRRHGGRVLLLTPEAVTGIRERGRLEKPMTPGW